jgi:hypothetical protein
MSNLSSWYFGIFFGTYNVQFVRTIAILKLCSNVETPALPGFFAHALQQRIALQELRKFMTSPGLSPRHLQIGSSLFLEISGISPIPCSGRYCSNEVAELWMNCIAWTKPWEGNRYDNMWYGTEIVHAESILRNKSESTANCTLWDEVGIIRLLSEYDERISEPDRLIDLSCKRKRRGEREKKEREREKSNNAAAIAHREKRSPT